MDRVLESLDAHTKIVFICSPNNPTGQSMARADVETICRETAGRALVVIDEAYHEFANDGHFLELRNRYEHVVLLRTLSKFVSLAGVRCGLLVAAPEVVEFAQAVLPPYTFPTPSIEHVLEALSGDSLRVSEERVELSSASAPDCRPPCSTCRNVTKVYPSDANFVIVRARERRRVSRDRAPARGVLVRTFEDPLLVDCVRITVGRPQDNDLLLRAVSGVERGDHA